MAYRLKNHLKAVPGSFRYEQTEGVQFKFPSTPLIRELAAKVANFREANGLPRAKFEEAFEDVDLYNCQRLGNPDRFCYQTDKAFAETVAIPGKGGCCGTPVG